MKIDQHIANLIKGNDMVIIPSVGGIVAHNCEAVIHAKTGEIQPAGRSFSFNPKLTYQDGLLVQSYMQQANLSQNEALIEVNLAIDALKKRLSSSEAVIIGEVGTFTKNTEGHIQFLEHTQSVETIDMFGLSRIQLEKLDKKEVDFSTNANSIGTTSNAKTAPYNSSKTYPIGKWIAAAAVFILMFFVTKPVSDERLSLNIAGPTFDFLENSQMVAPIEKREEPVVHNSEETINEADISVLPELPQVKYCIVVSSLANKRAADKKLAYYIKSGFKNASIITGNGRYRISIGNFSNKEIGIKKLNEIRAFSSRYKDAWLLKSHS